MEDWAYISVEDLLKMGFEKDAILKWKRMITEEPRFHQRFAREDDQKQAPDEQKQPSSSRLTCKTCKKDQIEEILENGPILCEEINCPGPILCEFWRPSDWSVEVLSQWLLHQPNLRARLVPKVVGMLEAQLNDVGEFLEVLDEES